jgi:hypothetical protein
VHCGSSSTPSSGSSPNLIVNGDAESAMGSTDGTPVTTPAWTVTGEATAIQYGTGSYPQATDPGPTHRGKNFLAGGQDDTTSTFTQTVDVTRYSGAIDGGRVTYALAGWLGGWESQDDNATLTVTFQDASGNAAGSGLIGPVLASDRNSVTSFLLETTNGNVPKGTRSVLVVLTMIRTDGAANDGYADNLSLVFQGV